MPTTAQTIKCFQRCQDLIRKYCSIERVALDEPTQHFVMLAGQEIGIEIEPNCEWRFAGAQHPISL